MFKPFTYFRGTVGFGYVDYSKGSIVLIHGWENTYILFIMSLTLDYRSTVKSRTRLHRSWNDCRLLFTLIVIAPAVGLQSRQRYVLRIWVWYRHVLVVSWFVSSTKGQGWIRSLTHKFLMLDVVRSYIKTLLAWADPERYILTFPFDLRLSTDSHPIMTFCISLTGNL